MLYEFACEQVTIAGSKAVFVGSLVRNVSKYFSIREVVGIQLVQTRPLSTDAGHPKNKSLDLQVSVG